MKSNRTLWVTVSLVALAVLAVIALIIANITRGGNNGANTSNSDVAAPESDTNTPENGEKGKEPAGDGAVSTDMRGNTVHDYGDVGKPLTNEQREVDELCFPEEQQRSPEGLEIQRANGVMTVWSQSDGPTTNSDANTPERYAHTPAGAALAAANIMQITGAGGDAAMYVLKNNQYWSPENREAADNLLGKMDERGIDRPEDIDIVPVPDAHRVISCSEEQVVVEVAQPIGIEDDDTVWSRMRFPMVWKDGDWKLNGDDQNDPDKGIEEKLDGTWIKWDL